MTARQWTIVQYALKEYQMILRGCEGGGWDPDWDDENDGEPPTSAEIDRVVEELSYER